MNMTISVTRKTFLVNLRNLTNLRRMMQVVTKKNQAKLINLFKRILVKLTVKEYTYSTLVGGSFFNFRRKKSTPPPHFKMIFFYKSLNKCQNLYFSRSFLGKPHHYQNHPPILWIVLTPVNPPTIKYKRILDITIVFL